MRSALLLCIAVLTALPAAAMAGPRALLVGVSTYGPEVTRIAGTLAGPGQDVALMTRTLAELGVAAAEMTILTDKPELLPPGHAARAPTRDHILAALDALAEGAAPGDRIVIYVAGHGAQVPARDASEPDGRDEVFLPADFDIGPNGAHRNLIRDDEIGARIDRMIGRGADVWLIADTCHSGSLRRSAGTDATARFVNLMGSAAPAEEHLPLVDMAEVRTARPGQFVGFYAASAGALAYETRPPGVSSTHGLLTWSLVGALRSGSAPTYADLARRVSAELWQNGQGRAAPEFSGAVAQAQMFASGKARRGTYGLQVGSEIVVKAGRVDGLVPGAILQIMDAAGTALFDTTIGEVSLTRARAPLPHGPLPALDAVLQAEGLDAARFRDRWLTDRAPTLAARVVSRPLELGLPVGVDVTSLPSEMRAAVARRIDALAPAIRRDDAHPLFSIVAEKGVLHLRPAPRGAAAALSVPAVPHALADLEAMLRRAAKSRGLLSVARALRDTPLAEGLAARIEITPGVASAGGGCKAGAQPPVDAPDASLPPKVRQCDVVAVTLANRHPWPVDVTPLYLAPDHQIYFLGGYDGVERGGWRIPPDGASTLRYTEATRQADGQPLATGPLNLVFFAERGIVGRDPVDFRYLQDAQPPPRQRAGSPDTLRRLLTEAGFGLVKFRSIDQTETAQSGALVLTLETVPDGEAGRIEP